MGAAPIVIDFVMHGSRAAIAGGLSHIEEQVYGIERAVVENPGLAFDLAKTLIESACRTILADRGVGFSPDDDLPTLFRTATNHLPFLPPAASQEGDVRRSLLRTLSGLSTAVQGVCELRNACGFASHGSSDTRPRMESVQALLAAETADAIVGFLHRVHRHDRISPDAKIMKYEDNPDFNVAVDEIHARFRIYNEEFEPSRVLFEMAPEPYRMYLSEFRQTATDAEPPTDSTVIPESTL